MHRKIQNAWFLQGIVARCRRHGADFNFLEVVKNVSKQTSR